MRMGSAGYITGYRADVSRAVPYDRDAYSRNSYGGKASARGGQSTRRKRSPFGWGFRILLVLVVLLVAAGIFLLFQGPQKVEETYYPLEYEEYIQEAAERHQINPYLICAVIRCESNWDPEVESSAGAVGLMQLLPETAADLEQRGLVDGSVFSASDLSDPQTNIEYGTAYLRYLVDRYHEVETVIAAYNAGLGNVDSWLENGENIRDVVEFAETENYLYSVINARESYEQLYPDAFDWE